MHTHCPACGVSFEPEPGFYYGAMFVSYAFTVAIFAVIALAIYLFFNPANDSTYIIAIITGAVVTAPWSFRYSRICFLYWFGGIKRDQSPG